MASTEAIAQIQKLHADGMSGRQIAAKLGIPASTAAAHVKKHCAPRIKEVAPPPPRAIPAGFMLANPIPPTKWEAQRAKERISLDDHRCIPVLNSTMRGTYEGRELHYRGRQA